MLRDLLKERILILDGAMGTNIQKYGLTEADYRGEIFKNHSVDLRGNNDVLALTRPDVIRDIHRRFLEAGADIIEANTFGSNKISQSEYGLTDYIKELNRASVKLAKEVAKEYSTPYKPRFVAGSVGPTGKTASISPDVENPSYRNITFDDLAEAYSEQAEVLVEVGVDAFLVETIFDTLNAKAAIYAINQVQKEKGTDIPVMISVTLTDRSGRTLSGQELEAFYYSIETMYRNFVNEINSFTDDSYYIKNKKRIDEVYYSSLDIGWGFGDEIEDIHNEIKWRYNEG